MNARNPYMVQAKSKQSFLFTAEDIYRTVPSPKTFTASDLVLYCVYVIPDIRGESHLTVRKVLGFKNAATD